MSTNTRSTRRALTLVELIIAVCMSILVISAIAAVLVDSQQGWHRTYNDVHSEVVTDSLVARKTFDAVIRKASRETLLVDDTGSWVEVYHYSGASAEAPDRFARFFVAEGALNVEHGSIEPRVTSNVRTVCRNVTSCLFQKTGRSVQMVLTLDDGSKKVTVVSAARMQNG
ncbi:MAG: hypothetical protein ACYTEX_12300 [Planctomycetota bacterium]